MKNITTNKLQSELSRVIKEVESGEIYQVNRYSEPVAYLVSKPDYEELISRSSCKGCVEDLRTLVKSSNLKIQNDNVESKIAQ